MITVHMIGNAHLDPVWLWPWQRGADEALATCRSGCELLDEFPEATFTRGEAWVYEQVRVLDPELFTRVKAHVHAGRWAVVNGWWLQPDVNLPTHEALLAGARLGRDWFREHLGVTDVPVAYLVDSFGHGAFLPRLIREAGQRYFVMMRPMESEKTLPSSLFRWRSPDGHEVLTYRLPAPYVCPQPKTLQGHITGTLHAPRPAGVNHVMCCYGVGNHGGGPTRNLIEWIRAHREFAPGVRLEFSSPQRYFAAVEKGVATFPVVVGELQHHAIGCYSVCGALKRELRSAELLAGDTERLAGPQPELDAAWRTICFNQFHDIIAGSSINEATETARQQIGGAREAVEAVLYQWTRRQPRPRTGHRLHVVNRAPVRWTGLADVEVALDISGGWKHHLVNEGGESVPCQVITPSSLLAEKGLAPMPRVLFPVALAPGAAHTYQIEPGPADAPPGEVVRVEYGREGVAQIFVAGAPVLAQPMTLDVIDDDSDTWGHGLKAFAGEVRARADFGRPVATETGPWRTTWRLDGTIGASRARLFVAVERGVPRVDCRLDVNYQEPFSLLKAVIAPAGGVRSRLDRVGGGCIERECDGREYPVHHLVRVNDLHVIFPDSFAADATAERVRVTLLRNNVHAYHSTSGVPREQVPDLHTRFGTDEGPQTIRWSLHIGAVDVESAVAYWQRPPVIWDDYRGISRVQNHETTCT